MTRRKPGRDIVFEPVPEGKDPRMAPILELPLSVATLNRLTGSIRLREQLDGAPLVFAGDLEKFSRADLLRVDGIGRVSVLEIEAWLTVNGMKLRPTPAEEWNRDTRRKAGPELAPPTLPPLLQGVQFRFRDGFAVVFVQTDANRFQVMSGGLNADPRRGVDGFGVPYHEHLMATVETSDDFWSLLERHTKVHGLPIGMAPAYMRYLTATAEGPQSWLVLAEAGSPHRPGYAVVGLKTVRPVNVNGNGTAELPEHQHWLPAPDPMPLAAALWIFQHMTAEQLDAGLQACNCPAPTDAYEDA